MLAPRTTRFAALVGLALLATWAPAARGATLLRWQFAVGQNCQLLITQEMQMKMVMQDNTTLVTTVSRMDFDWEITAVDDQGVATLTQKVGRIQMKMHGPQGVMMEYDSQSDKKPEGLATMMSAMFSAMLDKPFVTRMNPQGNIVDIKLPQGLAESVGKLPGGAQLGNMFSEQGMKSMSEVATFPDQALEPGDTWTRQATIQNPMTGDVTVENLFRYVGPETRDGRELEKIAWEMKMNFGEGGQAVIKVADQSSDGTIYFDNVAGVFESGRMKSSMKLQMSVLGQQIEQQMETLSTTERVPPKGEQPEGE